MEFAMSFLHILNQKKIQLDIEETSTLCPNILADEVKISQVIRNLVSNAIKFSFPETSLEIQYGSSTDESFFFLVRNHVGWNPAGRN